MLAMVFSGLLLGEASLPAESDRAEQLLREALAAHGGQASASTLRFALMRGTWSFLSRGQVVKTESFELHAGPAGKLRAHFSGAGGERILVTNGEVGWVRRGPELRALPRLEIENRLFELNPILGLFNRYLKGRLSLPWDPQDDDEGNVKRIRIYLEPSPRQQGRGCLRPLRRMYEVQLDRQTGRVARLVAFHLADSFFSSPMETLSFRYGDFRTVGKLLVPFQIEIHSQGPPYALVELDSFASSSKPPDVSAP